MRIFIHAGMHKTGTTSIQSTILNNGRKLESLGYRVFVNRPQLNAKNTAYFDPAWIRHQVAIAEKDGLLAVIFSAEMISTFNSRQLAKLVDTFFGHEVNLVICFRHWVGFLPSRWAQNCSRRDTQSFPQYLKNLQINEDMHIDARFDPIVKNMIATKPNDIRILSYDNAIAMDGLLPTCLSAFDLPQTFVNHVQDDQIRLNIRQDLMNTEIIRLFNGIYSLRHALEPNELFLGIMQAIPVRQFYDFSQQVLKLLQGNEGLREQVIDAIKESRVKMSLSRKDNNFDRWEKFVEEMSMGFLVNPDQGKLFKDVTDTEFVCSEIEVGDLRLPLQDKMAVALGIG